jgi:tetratricopeptide (TPR) repeat protein
VGWRRLPSISRGRLPPFGGGTGSCGVVPVGVLLAPVTLPPPDESLTDAGSIAIRVSPEILASTAAVERPEAGQPAPSPVPAQSGVQAYQRGDMEGAARLFREAIEQNPRDAESLNNLGQMLRLGDPSGALDYFNRAVELNDRKWSYRFNRARAAGLAGDSRCAIAEYRAADELFPDDCVTLFNLGLALQDASEHGEANALLRRAATLAPEEPGVHFALGLGEERLGRGQDAVGHYRRYLALAPAAGDAAAVQARIGALAGTAPPDSQSPTFR